MKRYACTVAAGLLLALAGTSTASAGRNAMSVHPLGSSSPRRKVTPRELEELALIADGYSAREIAQALWITEETVRTHVRRPLERLGARTRAQAVTIADGREPVGEERAGALM